MPKTIENQQCSSCSMRNMCISSGLEPSEVRSVDSIISQRVVVKKGDFLYRNGENFTHLLAIKSGHFKTIQIDGNGQDYVTRFAMPGEVLGLDGFAQEKHIGFAQAIEDSEVCMIPMSELNGLIENIPTLMKQFHRLLSNEMMSNRLMMALLSTMNADQKFASFLTNLSARYLQRGHSETTFQLKMTREDIAKYLGLTLESISRLMTKFRKAELIEVNNRNIFIKDLPALKQIVVAQK